MAYQVAVAPLLRDYVVVINLSDIVAAVVGIVVIYIMCKLLLVATTGTSSSTSFPVLVVYMQSRDGPYKSGSTVVRVLRSGIPANHPIVYVCLSNVPPLIMEPSNTTTVKPAVKSAITRSVANINPAVLSGSLDTVRHILHHGHHAATIAHCCTLLGVESQTGIASVLSAKPSVFWTLETIDDDTAVVVCAAAQSFGCHAHRNLLPTLQAAAATR